MKKLLGNILFFYAFHLLQASDLYDANISVNTTTPYIKEAVKIDILLKQKKKSHIMYFSLQAPKNPDYLLIFEGKHTINDNYYKKFVRYSYLLYPLKSGDITLEFGIHINLATEGSLDKFSSGSRDKFKLLESHEYHEKLSPINLHIQDFTKPVTLVGDFTLTMQIEKKEVSAYEQLNVHYTLKGEGYNPHIKTLLTDISDVETFLQVSHENKMSQSFHYALIGQKDFIVPEVTLSCFSPTKKKYYTLRVPQQQIKVAPLRTDTLVDKQNSLPQESYNLQELLPYLNGVLLFLAGFVIAKITPSNYFTKTPSLQNPHHDKIGKTKDEKALLQLLLSLDDKRYHESIIRLEKSIYRGEKVDLKALKERLLKV